MKSPSIEVSALVASAIITLVSGEWWHWVPVIGGHRCVPHPAARVRGVYLWLRAHRSDRVSRTDIRSGRAGDRRGRSRQRVRAGQIGQLRGRLIGPRLTAGGLVRGLAVDSAAALRGLTDLGGESRHDGRFLASDLAIRDPSAGPSCGAAGRIFSFSILEGQVVGWGVVVSGEKSSLRTARPVRPRRPPLGSTGRTGCDPCLGTRGPLPASWRVEKQRAWPPGSSASARRGSASCGPGSKRTGSSSTGKSRRESTVAAEVRQLESPERAKSIMPIALWTWCFRPSARR